MKRKKIMQEMYEDLRIYDHFENVNELQYCIRIIYDDGTIYTDNGRALEPQLLIYILDEGDGMIPEFDTLDEMLELIYEKLDRFKRKKEHVVEIQIYNFMTKKIIQSQKF